MPHDVARGSFMGDHVLVLPPSDASRLRSRGRFGVTVGKGSLRLDLVEALHLMDEGRLRTDASRGDILRAGYESFPDFGVRYIAYSELRGRGISLAAGSGERTFRALPRGDETAAGAGTAVVAASERGTFSFGRVLALADGCAADGLSLMLSVVDDEGDVTHYSAARADPRGEAAFDPPDGEIVLLGDRAIVDDPAAATAVHEGGFFGRRLPPVTVLSLIEAAHLGAAGMRLMRGGVETSPETALAMAERLDPDARLKLAAYAELRGRGLIPKTGFKFGGHFRVYDSLPRTKRESDRTHARYIVQVVPASYEARWEEISRTVRLAHGVRKEMLLFAPPDRFLAISRVRP